MWTNIYTNDINYIIFFDINTTNFRTVSVLQVNKN